MLQELRKSAHKNRLLMTPSLSVHDSDGSTRTLSQDQYGEKIKRSRVAVPVVAVDEVSAQRSGVCRHACCEAVAEGTRTPTELRCYSVIQKYDACGAERDSRNLNQYHSVIHREQLHLDTTWSS